jgi:hypothetical protein
MKAAKYVHPRLTTRSWERNLYQRILMLSIQQMVMLQEPMILQDSVCQDETCKNSPLTKAPRQATHIKQSHQIDYIAILTSLVR